MGDVIKSNTVIGTNYLMTREIVDYSNKNNSFLILHLHQCVWKFKHFLETEKITIGPPTNESTLMQCQN